MTSAREEMEGRLKTLVVAKKAAKGVDDAAFVKNSAAIVALLEEIARLPEDGKLTDFQVGMYCWALEAIASKTHEPLLRRDAAVRLVKAYRKAVDSPQFWGDPRACDFGRTFFNAMVVCLHRVVKECNVEARETVLRKVARPFTEILSLRATAFLDEAGFKKEKVTDAQRLAMERNNGGKPIKMKEWPSIAEKTFSILNHCLRVDSALTVSKDLIDFLYSKREKGTWLGFYCANAMMHAGRHEEARSLLTSVVQKNPDADWAWTYLSETYRDAPEEALACLCRSLTCSNRNPEIAKATEAKTHRQLAKILTALGDSVTAAREIGYANGTVVSVDDSKRYVEEAKTANRLVFGNDEPPVKKRQGKKKQGDDSPVKFEGTLVKLEGRDFGFVRCVGLGDVFVPPRFALGTKPHTRIVGMAALREDKKKKRMSLCMISAL